MKQVKLVNVIFVSFHYNGFSNAELCSSKAGFLNHSTSDMWGQMTICHGVSPLYCRLFSNIPGLYPLGASRTSHLQFRITIFRVIIWKTIKLFYPNPLLLINLVKTIDFGPTLKFSERHQSLANDHGQVI